MLLKVSLSLPQFLPHNPLRLSYVTSTVKSNLTFYSRQRKELPAFPLPSLSPALKVPGLPSFPRALTTLRCKTCSRALSQQRLGCEGGRGYFKVWLLAPRPAHSGLKINGCTDCFGKQLGSILRATKVSLSCWLSKDPEEITLPKGESYIFNHFGLSIILMLKNWKRLENLTIEWVKKLHSTIIEY